MEIERLMKARLAFLDEPRPTDDLVNRLLALGGPSGPLPSRPGHVPGSPRPKPVPLSRPVPSRPVVRLRERAVRAAGAPGRPGIARPGPGHPGGGSRRGRIRLAGAVLGALGVVGAGVGGLVLAAPSVSATGGAGPAADQLTVQQRSPSPSSTGFETASIRIAPPLGARLPGAYHGSAR
jgi:hypothetical protein